MDRNVQEQKTLQQLTFKDAFMFAAVMLDEDNARGVLERILNIEIDHVVVDVEKTMFYHPEYKGVRLDVYVKDDKGTHYDVEMQVANQKIQKRSRYYHSQIDMELLETGLGYKDLPDAYVIFICDYDPIGLKKYKYTRRQTLREDETYEYEDGSHTIFLSTKGTNEDEVPEPLVKFLKYVGAELMESNEDYKDEFIAKLQNTVKKVKANREMGARYMTMQEFIKDECKAAVQKARQETRQETMQEAILNFLRIKGEVSEVLEEKITSIKDTDMLSAFLIKAAQAQSIQEFEQELENYRMQQQEPEKCRMLQE